jgi:hypothetical protein
MIFLWGIFRVANFFQVYGALVEYRATGILQNIPFTEGAYEDIYRNHMRTLIDTRATAPVALHHVLHRLYILVTYCFTLPRLSPYLCSCLVSPQPPLV